MVITGEVFTRDFGMATCGTGTGNFPQPGDPDLYSPILTARPEFGGILLTWTYPGLNPQAVAHTEVFRSSSSSIETAVFHRIASGNSFFDDIVTTATVTYYYWIRMVSIFGTVGPMIGPASATLNSTADRIIDLLEGQISDSLLNQDLRDRIDSIIGVQSELQLEIAALMDQDGWFSSTLAALQNGMDTIDTLIATETTQRITGDSALVAQLNLWAAKVEDNMAAIAEETLARVNEDEALAGQITLLTADFNTELGLVNSAISAEALARSTADNAFTAQISSLQTSVGDNAAAILNEASARSNADSSLASSIFTLESQVGSNSSAISTVQTVIGGLEAQYMVKLDVNGYVSGFGLYNSGGSSNFQINADSFAIGKPGYPNEFPFIIGQVNGVTKIALNAATVIPDLSVDTLKIAGNAVTIPVASQASNGSILLNGSLTAVSTGITISGLPAGQQAGVTVVGNISVYPSTTTFRNYYVRVYVGGTLAGYGSASTDQHGVNIVATGTVFVPNGTYTVSMELSASGTGNVAYDAGIIAMGSKR